MAGGLSVFQSQLQLGQTGPQLQMPDASRDYLERTGQYYEQPDAYQPPQDAVGPLAEVWIDHTSGGGLQARAPTTLLGDQVAELTAEQQIKRQAATSQLGGGMDSYSLGNTQADLVPGAQPVQSRPAQPGYSVYEDTPVEQIPGIENYLGYLDAYNVTQGLDYEALARGMEDPAYKAVVNPYTGVSKLWEQRDGSPLPSLNNPVTDFIGDIPIPNPIDNVASPITEPIRRLGGPDLRPTNLLRDLIKEQTGIEAPESKIKGIYDFGFAPDAPLRKPGQFAGQKVEDITGSELLGTATEYALAPETLVALTSLGTGIIPSLVGRGAMSTAQAAAVEAFAALGAAGGEAAAKELGLPPILGALPGALVMGATGPATTRLLANLSRGAYRASSERLVRTLLVAMDDPALRSGGGGSIDSYLDDIMRRADDAASRGDDEALQRLLRDAHRLRGGIAQRDALIKGGASPEEAEGFLMQMLVKTGDDIADEGAAASQLYRETEGLTKRAAQLSGESASDLRPAARSQVAEGIGASTRRRLPPVQGGSEYPQLPRDLASGKPRYNYGQKKFQLDFESDIDKAAFIASQTSKSKRDADYLRFAMQHLGMDEEGVRRYGQEVRNRLKSEAASRTTGGTISLKAVTQFDELPQPSKPLVSQPSSQQATPPKQPELGLGRDRMDFPPEGGPQSVLDGFGLPGQSTMSTIADNIKDVAAVSKYLQTSGDVVGAPFRQGHAALFQFPAAWWKGTKESVINYFADPKAENWRKLINQERRYTQGEILNDVIDPKTGKRVVIKPFADEIPADFQVPGMERPRDSALMQGAEGFPLAKRSENAMRAFYLSTGNDIRNALIDDAIRAGVTDQKWFDYYSRLARIYVLRGDVPKQLEWLSNNFYSLQNVTGRFQQVIEPFKAPGSVFDVRLPGSTRAGDTGGIFSASPRGVATRSLLRFAAGEMANLHTLSFVGQQTGLFDVGWNPLEPGFGRATFNDKNGNEISVDLLGGWGSYIKAVSRTGASAAGDQRFDPFAEWVKFFRYKAAPAPSLLIDNMAEYTELQKLDALDSPFAKPLGEMTASGLAEYFVPFFATDTVQAFLDGALDVKDPADLLTAAGFMLSSWGTSMTNLYPPTPWEEEARRLFPDKDPSEIVLQSERDAVTQAVRERPDYEGSEITTARIEQQDKTSQQRDLAENAFLGGVDGGLTKALPDRWRDLNLMDSGASSQRAIDYKEQIAGFNPRPYDPIIDQYFDLTVENVDGTLDWDATEQLRDEYLNGLLQSGGSSVDGGPTDAEYLLDYLGWLDQQGTPFELEFRAVRDEMDAAGFYEIPSDDPKAKAEFWKQNPALEAQYDFWNRYEEEPTATLQSQDAVDTFMLLNQQYGTDWQVKQAPFQFVINENEGTMAAWQEGQQYVELYYGTEAEDRTKLRDQNKAFDAWIYYLGYSANAKLRSRAAGAIVQQLNDKYGTNVPIEYIKNPK